MKNSILKISLLSILLSGTANAAKKEDERICKGFYKNVYTQYNYNSDLVLNSTENILFDMLSSADYGWVPQTTKSNVKKSNNLAKELKEMNLT